MAPVLRALAGSPAVHLAEVFVAWFPVLFAFLAINASRQFFLDRRGIVTQRLEPAGSDVADAQERWPLLTVLLPVHNGASTVELTLLDLARLDWPVLEVIVVDDGSTDGTGAVLDRWADVSSLLRVVHKAENEGKSAALNDGLALARGELVLICDDDVVVPPETAALLAAQLVHHDDLAGVTANPRMVRTGRLIEKLQAIEFSATVSTQRRGHAAWGRISTLSGVCTLFRAEALRAVGGFDPTQPAEDIELTWRLQTRGWRVGYEPHAAVGTVPAPGVRAWFRQRRRWAAGLVRALQANGSRALRPANAAVWPLLLEATASIVWCHLLVALTVLWLCCLAAGVPPVGNGVLIGAWGTVTVCVAVTQILWGMHLDAEDDPGVRRVRWYVPLFPLAYWWMMSMTVVSVTLPTLCTPRRRERWE